MVWYKYGFHEYMDEKPEFGFKLFKDEKDAKAWEAHMKSYSGGITWLEHPATKQELIEFIKKNDITLDSLTEANINNEAYYKK